MCVRAPFVDEAIRGWIELTAPIMMMTLVMVLSSCRHIGLFDVSVVVFRHFLVFAAALIVVIDSVRIADGLIVATLIIVAAKLLMFTARMMFVLMMLLVVYICETCYCALL